MTEGKEFRFIGLVSLGEGILQRIARQHHRRAFGDQHRFFQLDALFPADLAEYARFNQDFLAWVQAEMKAGESFLVHGGSSGIGTTAIQLAKAFGARVFTTAGGAEKCTACRKLGAEVAIDYRTEDYVELVSKATEGRGVDVILDMVGGDYILRNLKVLALEGRLVQIAFLKGSTTEINLLPLMMKRQTLTGSTLRPRSVAEKGVIADALRKKVWPLLDAGSVAPIIHATFPLAKAADAHRLMESSAHVGKIVLTTD
jgi:NADPH2:quinone reductase